MKYIDYARDLSTDTYNYCIDFEYYQDKGKIHPVCVSVRYVDIDTHNEYNSEWWLDESGIAAFKHFIASRNIRAWHCYSVAAEASAFLALGIDLTEVAFYDSYLMYKQLRNHHPKYMYGQVFNSKLNKYVKSIPYNYDTDDMELSEISHKKVGASLASALKNILNLEIDTEHKNQMRDVIITKKGNYSAEEKSAILRYCSDDTRHLLPLYEELKKIFLAEGVRETSYDSSCKMFSLFHKNMAICTHRGYPIHPQRLQNIMNNYENIVETAIVEANKQHPFFEKTKKGYVRKMSNFADYVASKGWSNWPKTGKGALKTTEKVLSSYEGDLGIAQLKATVKLMKQVQSFRPEAIGEFLDHVCSDHRLHHNFGVFGTQSGRNAPPAKLFIFAMASWLRCLISPKPGRAITGIDWSSQEFAVAAALSQDVNMLEAYAYGDPYVYFAQWVGAIPAELSKDEAKKQFPKERDFFKSTILGLQYGMGAESLAQKLSVDMKTDVSYEKAKEMRSYHQKLFKRYWQWLNETERQHRDPSAVPLHTADKWILFRDPEQPTLSVLNFPTQATSASIMRLAVHKAHQAGLSVLAPLHDAIYIEHDEGDDDAPQTLGRVMQDAVAEILPGLVIRQDAKTITSRDIWVEPKGRKMLSLLLKYIDPQATLDI